MGGRWSALRIFSDTQRLVLTAAHPKLPDLGFEQDLANDNSGRAPPGDGHKESGKERFPQAGSDCAQAGDGPKRLLMEGHPLFERGHGALRLEQPVVVHLYVCD